MTPSSMRGRILSAIGFGGVLAGMILPGCGGKSLDGDDSTTGGSGSGGQAGTGGKAGSGGTSGSGGTAGTGGIPPGGSGGIAGTGGIGNYGGTGGIVGTGGVGNYGGTGGIVGTGGVGNYGGTGGGSCIVIQSACYPPEVYRSWGMMGAGGAAGAAGDLGSSGAPPAACPPEVLRPLGSPCVSNYGPPMATSDLTCCYPTLVDQCCLSATGGTAGVGRPFLVGGAARVASTAARIDWSAPFEAAAEPAQPFADLWLADARLEHASVASFARLSLQLLELGAPSDLVEDTHRAALDEIAHARLCFAQAARYTGTPVGPGPLATRDALGATSFEAVAVAAVIEGCIGETVAALIAEAQRAGASDRAARGALARIAEDEAVHAELSWRVLRWALASGGAGVHRAVRAAFERAVQDLRSAEVGIDSLPEAVLNAHGRLSARQTRDVTLRALAEVIEPCAWALLEHGAAHVAAA